MAHPTGWLSTDGLKSSNTDVWDVLPPDYHVFGQLIILRLKLGFTDLKASVKQDVNLQSMPTQLLDAVQITPSAFSKLLFFDTLIHKRKVYLSRIMEISQEKSVICLTNTQDLDII